MVCYYRINFISKTLELEGGNVLSNLWSFGLRITFYPNSREHPQIITNSFRINGTNSLSLSRALSPSTNLFILLFFKYLKT